MLKVIIVDDENKIIKLIRYLVDWSSYDMEIAGTANDGQTALSLILSQKPDIVITDVRIPNFTGVELVQKTLTAGLCPYFIIISGYSDFKYAQQAIKLGVEDYLLKPIKKNDLDAALTKIISKNNIAHENSLQVERLLNTLSKNEHQVKSQLLTDLLIKHASLENSAVKELYNCEFSGDSFRCIIFYVFCNICPPDASPSEEYQYILPRLQKAVGELISGYCSELFSIIYNEKIIFLSNYNQAMEKEIISQLQKLKLRILNYRSIYPELSVKAVLGRRADSFAGFYDSYSSACHTIQLRFQQINQLLMAAEDYQTSGIGNPSLNLQADKNELLQKIELLDIEGFTDSMIRIRNRLTEKLSYGDTLCQHYSILAETILFGFGMLPVTEPETRPDAAMLLKGLDYYEHFDAAFDYMTALCASWLCRYKENKLSENSRPIRLAQKYIQEHYNESITLETVSKITGFHPAYFSSLFKKSTNQNFMDYLTDIRITHAKEMLIQTDQDISDIAASVGYTDLEYFVRIFKRATHLTPTKFRKLYS